MPFINLVSIHISRGEWPVHSLGLFVTNMMSDLHRVCEWYIRYGGWPAQS